LERIKTMRNLRTSKYNKTINYNYFVKHVGVEWQVVEFPSNDIVQTFDNQSDAEMLSEQIKRVKPFGDDRLPPFIKGNNYHLDEERF